MKPYIHAKNSVNKHGGKIEDYLPIHNFFDQTKAHFPDMRHRCILHNSFGIYLCEQVFGITLTNSDNKIISVRDIGEDHVISDLGFIPTVQDYLQEMPFLDWFSRLSAEETNADIKTNMRPKKEKIVKDLLKPTEIENAIMEIVAKTSGGILPSEIKIPGANESQISTACLALVSHGQIKVSADWKMHSPDKTEDQLKEEFKKITEEMEKDQKEKLPHTPQGLDPADIIIDGAGNPFYKRSRGRALD